LSREAERAVFLECNSRAIDVIRENLASCHFEDRAQVIKGDVFKTLPALIRNYQQFDYVYVDPPFRRKEYYAEIINLLPPLLSERGCSIVRSPKALLMPEAVAGMSRKRISAYGESVLNYYVRSD
jgi:16S rRNA (guanine(966)-N(2))-methyltransferase RsmD